jgi:cell division protein FtsW
MQGKKTIFNSPVIVTVLILLVLGTVMIYSASSFKAHELVNDSNFFLIQHLYRLAAGILIMLIVASLDYRVWLRLSPALVGISVLALLYLLISAGVAQIRGSRRWIDLGPINVQPSDFARIALILFLSLFLGSEPVQKHRNGNTFLTALGIVTIVVIPIMLQPDYGTAILTMFIALILLFLSGEKKRYLFGLTAVLGFALFTILWSGGSGYQKVRIERFLASVRGEEVAWQAQQSLIAFGNGNVLGVGLGGGGQKYHFLPDPYTDFIYAIVGEEGGIIGATTILVLFFILVRHGFKIASQSNNMRTKLLASGITLNIGIYAVVNAAVTLNLLPTTGIPMPFLSYGGSALISNLFGIGLLLSIARNNSNPSSGLQRITKRHANRLRAYVRV